MIILHPIPVRVLGRDRAVVDHFRMLAVHQSLMEGPESSYHEPEVKRWMGCETGLYDRYSKSRVYLKEEFGIEVIDQWVCPPAEGALRVYPIDSDEWVLSIWKIILGVA